MTYFERSLELHRLKRGKWEMHSKVEISSRDDLSLAYTPGVAGVCREIADNKEEVYNLTMKGNSVAIVSDGSAVLGLGDIGPEAALPVMEGKAILFKRFADIDGVPIVIHTKTSEEVIQTVKAIAPTFGGINLEDIKAPRCFEIEDALQEIGIPVFHDDQHGTAIVLLAALINASKIINKPLEQMTVVINGAGAAGAAIAKLLCCIGQEDDRCTPVKKVYLCDTAGVIHKNRHDIHAYKRKLLEFTNPDHREGTVFDILHGADVFIGVSAGNLLTTEDVRHMAKDAIIFAMANPIPEIMPDAAKASGAAVVGTGRSDLPNQVNNALAYPGIFRGALNAKATRITSGMKIAAAYALADAVTDLSAEKVIPHLLEEGISEKVAKAVYDAAIRDGVSRN